MKKGIAVFLFLALMLALAGCGAGANKVEIVATADAPEAIGPYSQAKIAGGFVYTSGQIGLDPSTGELREGLEAQCEQVFQNLSAVLEAAGSDMSKAVKVTVFITDMDSFSAVNEIYAKYFTEPYPARSCVEVSSLPKGALVECELIAVQ